MRSHFVISHLNWTKDKFLYFTISMYYFVNVIFIQYIFAWIDITSSSNRQRLHNILVRKTLLVLLKETSNSCSKEQQSKHMILMVVNTAFLSSKIQWCLTNTCWLFLILFKWPKTKWEWGVECLFILTLYCNIL